MASYEQTRGAALAWQQDHEHGWWMSGPNTPTTNWNGATGKTTPRYEKGHLQDTSSVVWRMITMGFRDQDIFLGRPLGGVMEIPG